MGAFGAPHERATLTIQSPYARGDAAFLGETSEEKKAGAGLLGGDSGGDMVTKFLRAIR